MWKKIFIACLLLKMEILVMACLIRKYGFS